MMPSLKLDRTNRAGGLPLVTINAEEFSGYFETPEALGDPVLVRFSGPLIGKERPRTGKFSPHFYTPTRSSHVETIIGFEGRKAMQGRAAFTGPVFCRICVFRKIPTSWSRKKTEMALKGIILPQTKPDIDNQIKTLFDGLKDIIYTDDNQIASKLVVRRYASHEGFIAEFREYIPERLASISER